MDGRLLFNTTVLLSTSIKSVRKKWTLDVSFTAKTQKLLFYFCLKWGRLHTGWKHPTVSGARVYPNHFIRCCALERWRMSQMTWIFGCFCKACNYGTFVWRSERMDDAVCHTAMSHSWPWLRCGLDQGFQRLQIQIRAGLQEQVQSTEARLVSMTQSIHRQRTRHAQHDAWRSFCGWHWVRKFPQLLIWGFFWPKVESSTALLHIFRLLSEMTAEFRPNSARRPRLQCKRRPLAP